MVKVVLHGFWDVSKKRCSSHLAFSRPHVPLDPWAKKSGHLEVAMLERPCGEMLWRCRFCRSPSFSSPGASGVRTPSQCPPPAPVWPAAPHRRSWDQLTPSTVRNTNTWLLLLFCTTNFGMVWYILPDYGNFNFFFVLFWYFFCQIVYIEHILFL